MASWIRIRIRNSDILSRGSGSVRKYIRIWNTLFTLNFHYLFQKVLYLLYTFLIFSKRGLIHYTYSLSFPKGALSTVHFPYLSKRVPIYCKLSLSFLKGALSTVHFPYLFQKGPYLDFPHLFQKRAHLDFPCLFQQRAHLDFPNLSKRAHI